VTDRDRWGLRGPVHTCRIQRTGYLRRCGPNSSEGDACETEERTDVTSLQFRPDGFLAVQRHQNPDGSEWTTTNEYDDAGRLTSMRNENGT
jgi:YD repeat-containing protein